ncbi:hypothetical protein B0H17DRAFT_1266218 [Mycena rosella]|uniref:Uncharacterized protein n=1 Tax=Mycena rosella TaxID=1033263 RepID=A0AAD7CNN4_MYCRO|nr:hypothetical protein B0H17DRAFT_1266218 [Mycena rosella]
MVQARVERVAPAGTTRPVRPFRGGTVLRCRGVRVYVQGGWVDTTEPQTARNWAIKINIEDVAPEWRELQAGRVWWFNSRERVGDVHAPRRDKKSGHLSTGAWVQPESNGRGPFRVLTVLVGMWGEGYERGGREYEGLEDLLPLAHRRAAPVRRRPKGRVGVSAERNGVVSSRMAEDLLMFDATEIASNASTLTGNLALLASFTACARPAVLPRRLRLVEIRANVEVHRPPPPSTGCGIRSRSTTCRRCKGALLFVNVAEVWTRKAPGGTPLRSPGAPTMLVLAKGGAVECFGQAVSRSGWCASRGYAADAGERGGCGYPGRFNSNALGWKSRYKKADCAIQEHPLVNYPLLHGLRLAPQFLLWKSGYNRMSEIGSETSCMATYPRRRWLPRSFYIQQSGYNTQDLPSLRSGGEGHPPSVILPPHRASFGAGR